MRRQYYKRADKQD